ncbi:MAG: hypothetical protein HOP19_20670 [Acidobacteria bacterium]|nr:hypothetical protein [Acidobacteriota bacterium]
MNQLLDNCNFQLAGKDRMKHVRASAKRIVLGVAGLCFLLSAIGFAVSKRHRIASAFLTLSPSINAAQTVEKPEVLLVTLSPTGFDPPQVSRAKRNPFLLVIENRTGLDAVALTLNRDTGMQLKAATIHPRKHTWATVLDLAAGKYVVNVTGLPEWKFDLTITP